MTFSMSGEWPAAWLSHHSVSPVAGKLPIARRSTTPQSTVPFQPWTPVPTALVAEA